MEWVTHLEFLVILVTLIGGIYMMDSKIERQAERTDKIYEMFVVVQNEIKDLTVRVAISEEKGKK
jgi:hypothetical protein